MPSNTGTGTPIAYHDNKVWFSTGSKEFVISLNVITFKPLTPPIELIDGGKYEFELCFGDYHLGYWKEERNSFFDSLLCANKICGKSEASNIQPLTVEVK